MLLREMKDEAMPSVLEPDADCEPLVARTGIPPTQVTVVQANEGWKQKGQYLIGTPDPATERSSPSIVFRIILPKEIGEYQVRC